MKKLLSLAVLTIVTLPVSATVIDFDSPGTPPFFNDAFAIGDMNFRSQSGNLVLWSPSTGNNGLLVEDTRFSNASVAMWTGYQEPFDLVSFVTRSTDEFIVSGQVLTASGSPVQVALVTLDELVSEAVGNLTRYYLPDTFNSVERVYFGAPSSVDDFFLDDITYTAAVVPLPPAAWLFMSGLGLLRAFGPGTRLKSGKWLICVNDGARGRT